MRLHRSVTRRTVDWLGLAALILLFVARPAQAHGGGVPQLINAEAGPYWVSVWTQPNLIRVGDFHVTVAISEAPKPGASTREAGDLVLDATVLVQAQPVSQVGETLIAHATRDNAVNKLFYEADLTLPADGQWQVDIQVNGAAGAGNAAFEIEALPPSAFNTLVGFGWPLWAFLGLVLLVAGWWFQMSRYRKGEVAHA